MGVLEWLGFGWEVCQDINLCLIYVLISGFGYDGDLWFISVLGYDLMVQVLFGVVFFIGSVDVLFSKVGVSIGDLVGGFYCV